MPPRRKTLEAPTGGWTDTCVEWPGKREADGYSRVRQNYKRVHVHRLSYTTFVGSIPDDAVVRHKCDNRACYNPIHLELGTHADNSRDMVSRDRQAKGSENSQSKLTEADVSNIKHTLLTGKRGAGKELAARYGVTATQISAIKHGLTWKHILAN